MSENGQYRAIPAPILETMDLEPEACYKALAAKDARFDGLFYVGVRTTSVYCRCVCSAKTPLYRNCSFFQNPALAEQAGYRPCLVCRPEVAPGRSRVAAKSRLAAIAVRRIEDGAMDEVGIGGLARDLGVTDRHLRRAVREEYGVAPVELLQTRRLLEAKRLLMDTALPIGEVALACGFSSLRRFNALFRERYRLCPSELRRSASRAARGEVRLEVGFRPPYDWESMLYFLSARAVPGVEQVADGRYARTVVVGERRGWISVAFEPTRNCLRVEVSSSLFRAIPQVLCRVRRLFDTASEPALVGEALGQLSRRRPGLRVPGSIDGFEIACRAILGQQVSVAAARTLAGRLSAACGTPVETPFPLLDRTFPGPSDVAGAEAGELSALGVVGGRSRALVALARAVSAGEVALSPGVDVDSTIKRLCEIEGIGAWTAQYIAMRALAYPDAFPQSDLAILRALGVRKPADALALAERWRPWRAYAALHLWASVGDER